ncbi:MAG: hypothetical protein WBG17_08415 [Burkholderiaceae bacterium]
MLKKACLPLLLLLVQGAPIFTGGALAAERLPLFSVKKQALPDLAAPAEPVRRFAMDGQAATVGGDTRDQTWTTRLDYASRTDAAMALDYGLRLDREFAGGANVVVGARRKELLLNAVYAPEKDLRVKLSGGQLRRTEDYQFASGAAADSVVQHNYLLDIRKTWSGDAFLSGLSLTAWHAYADEADPGQKLVLQDSDLATRVLVDPRTLATGAQRGYMLNLALAPLPASRLELGTGIDRLHYDFADGSGELDSTASRRLHYTQYVGGCSRLQGNYESHASWRSFGVAVAHGAWSIGASRTLDRDSGDGGYAINAGYTIPMGRSSGRTNTCASSLQAARSFGSIAGSSVAREPNLPAASLAQVDPTARPAISEIWAKPQ